MAARWPPLHLDIHEYPVGFARHGTRTITTISDWIAFRFVKLCGFWKFIFLHNDAVHRTLLLKTVAAVPDMHATLNRHFNALVKPGDNHKCERLVLDEAENKHRNAESPCALDEAIKQ